MCDLVDLILSCLRNSEKQSQCDWHLSDEPPDSGLQWVDVWNFVGFCELRRDKKILLNNITLPLI